MAGLAGGLEEGHAALDRTGGGDGGGDCLSRANDGHGGRGLRGRVGQADRGQGGDDFIHLLILEPMAALVDEVAHIADDEGVGPHPGHLTDQLVAVALVQALDDFVHLVSGVGANRGDVVPELLRRWVLLDVVIGQEEAQIVRGLGIALLGNQGLGFRYGVDPHQSQGGELLLLPEDARGDGGEEKENELEGERENNRFVPHHNLYFLGKSWFHNAALIPRNWSIIEIVLRKS